MKIAFDYDPVAHIYDELMQFIPYREWVNYIINLYYNAGGKGHNVIDCGCGTGSVSVLLSAHNFNVTAVDKSFNMLRVLQSKYFKPSSVIPVQSDITYFSSRPVYNLAVCMYDTVNHLSADDFRKFISNTYELLAPGGILMFDFNTSFGLETFSEDPFIRKGESFYSVWNTAYDREKAICSLELIVNFDNGSKERMFFSERPVDMQEIIKNSSDAGFSRTEFYEFLSYGKYNDYCERGMALCIKA